MKSLIPQIAIACLGVTAIWLSQGEQSRRRYACLFGLAGQPFWFWSAIYAEQWGIVVLCCLYTVSWARGVKTHWLKKEKSVEQVIESLWHARCAACSFPLPELQANAPDGNYLVTCERCGVECLTSQGAPVMEGS